MSTLADQARARAAAVLGAYPPGPYHVTKPRDGCCHEAGIADSEGDHVADIASKDSVPLFLAAPDMVAACEEAADVIEANVAACGGLPASVRENFAGAAIVLRAAVAKARPE